MKFSVSSLIEQIPTNGTLEIRKLERLLKCTKKIDKDNLAQALFALNKLGILNLDQHGVLTRQHDLSFIEAHLRCSSKGYCFAVREQGGEDIYIRDHQLNHAWHGDRVLVKITREGIRRRSPEGSVQCILERKTTNLLTSLEEIESSLIATPLDERILSTINITSPEDSIDLKNNQLNLAEVKIEKYPIAQYQAEGEIVRPLTLDNGIQGDRDIVLTKAGFNNNETAPRAILKSPSDKNRIDLTDQQVLIFKAWNTQGAPSLASIYAEEKDSFTRVWLHVPAVSERIGIGNTLDKWIREKGEAICLGDLWMPLLSNNLQSASSFKLDEANQAVSVALDFDQNAHLLSWEFCLSTIKPTAEITRDILSRVAKRKPGSKTVPIALKAIKDVLAQLYLILEFSQKLSTKAKNNGAVTLDLPPKETGYLKDLCVNSPDNVFNNWSLPLDVNDPNSVLKNFITEANRVWYYHSKRLNLPSFSINTHNIDNNILNDLAKSSLSLELSPELDDEGMPTPLDLLKAVSTSNHKHVIEKQLRHSLQPSKLELTLDNINPDIQENDTNDNTSLEGSLSFTQSPWTCPTLHYADLINQHLLVSLLNDAKTSPKIRDKTKVDLGSFKCWSAITWPLFSKTVLDGLSNIFNENLLRHLNTKRCKSREIINDFIAMAQARATEPLINKEVKGLITGVQSYGFFVEIPETSAEGLVHVSSLNDDWYEYRARQNKLVGRKSRKAFQLGEETNVSVLKVDVLRNQIDLALSDSCVDNDIKQETPNEGEMVNDSSNSSYN